MISTRAFWSGELPWAAPLGYLISSGDMSVKEREGGGKEWNLYAIRGAADWS